MFLFLTGAKYPQNVCNAILDYVRRVLKTHGITYRQVTRASYCAVLPSSWGTSREALDYTIRTDSYSMTLRT